MIVDSMRYWVREMHVDGFRFDLASVFSRNADGSINVDDPPIFGDITSDPDFDDVRMIAEPWDAAGAYELGRAFPGVSWLQWNGRFRDDVRRFVRGDAGMVGALMQRLYGSDDLFPDDPMNAYHAYQSVNLVTCHDGFTLYDLVAYDRKHNAANGHDGRDGPDESWSWNCGHEGEGATEQVNVLRERQAKNFIALLLLSNGTPMLRAGDEMLQTQHGNNNPYNQDNETSWLDWRLRDTQAGFFHFVQRMIAFRKAHPSLGRSRFWRDDVRWFGVRGPVDLGSDTRSLAVCLRGASQCDDDLYIMINSSAEDLVFAIQDVCEAPWRRAIDTAHAAPDDVCSPERQVPLGVPMCSVAARSIVALIRASNPVPRSSAATARVVGPASHAQVRDVLVRDAALEHRVLGAGGRRAVALALARRVVVPHRARRLRRRCTGVAADARRRRARGPLRSTQDHHRVSVDPDALPDCTRGVARDGHGPAMDGDRALARGRCDRRAVDAIVSIDRPVDRRARPDRRRTRAAAPRSSTCRGFSARPWPV